MHISTTVQEYVSFSGRDKNTGNFLHLKLFLQSMTQTCNRRTRTYFSLTVRWNAQKLKARGSMDRVKGDRKHCNTNIALYLKKFRKNQRPGQGQMHIDPMIDPHLKRYFGSLWSIMYRTSHSPCHHESKRAQPSSCAIRAQCACRPE